MSAATNLNLLPRRQWLCLALGFPALAGEPVVSPQLARLLSDEEEYALGAKVAAKVEAEHEVLADEAVSEFVRTIGLKLVEVSQRPNLKYEIKVINDGMINAFATFGGKIYVYRGLLHFVKDETELAGVLSHEVGHVAGRHMTKSLARDAQIGSLLKLAKATFGISDTLLAQVADLVVGATTALPLLQLSREDEIEADLLALYQLQRGGWNPDGLLSFLVRLTAGKTDPFLLETLLSTHPAPTDRQARVRAELREMGVKPRVAKASAEFLAMQERLKVLKPPPEKKKAERG